MLIPLPAYKFIDLRIHTEEAEKLLDVMSPQERNAVQIITEDLLILYNAEKEDPNKLKADTPKDKWGNTLQFPLVIYSNSYPGKTIALTTKVQDYFKYYGYKVIKYPVNSFFNSTSFIRISKP